MQIIIDGKEAVLKQGCSFDFIAENRLFSGSDSFTLTITFPLKDCLQNLEIFGHINRSELAIDACVFDCEIRDRTFSRFGTLTIMEISDVDVKAQFLQGRAEQNFSKKFDETYVNELDLGGWPAGLPSEITPEEAWNPRYTDWEAVALPWVSADSGTPHNFAEYNGKTFKYTWSSDVNTLSWQPYLIHIVRRICEAVGYTCDISEWEENTYLAQLIVCNTLPDGWDISSYARALPHWTVDEFFEKLEIFLRGEFDIDHRTRHITFRFFRKLLENTPAVRIDTVIDEYTSSIDTEGDKCEYLEAKAFRYSDQSLSVWKYLSCDWLFKNWSEDSIVHYQDYYSLYQDNKSYLSYNDAGGNHRNPSGSNVGKLLHDREHDMYFILRNISRTENGKDALGRTTYNYKRTLQPINELGAYLPEDTELDDADEIEFVPASVDFTEDKYGNVLFLSFSGYSEPDPSADSSSSTSGYSGPLWNYIASLNDDAFQKTGLQQMIETGEQDSPSEYYDKIYVGNYRGFYENGTLPYPISSSVRFGKDGLPSGFFASSLRINDPEDPRWSPFYRIDRTRKVTFKFLADDIPDPRALFYIHGRRYICEKVTATFAEDGMSQLLKGEFWPLLDD